MRSLTYGQEYAHYVNLVRSLLIVEACAVVASQGDTQPIPDQLNVMHVSTLCDHLLVHLNALPIVRLHCMHLFTQTILSVFRVRQGVTFCKRHILFVTQLLIKPVASAKQDHILLPLEELVVTIVLLDIIPLLGPLHARFVPLGHLRAL